MPSLSIRDLSAAALAALHRRAERNHRSLQGEVRAILERAAAHAPPERKLPAIRLKTVRTGTADALSRADIYRDDSLR